MPVSPDGARLFAKALADLYGDAAQHLIALVARRLAAGITDPGWAERKLAEILRLRGDAQRYVARLAQQSGGTVLDLLTEAYASGVLAAGGPGVREASPGIVATNRAAVQAYAAELAGTLASTHTRILRATEDIYRDVISQVAGQGVTGVQTRREVASRAMRRFAAHGITGFTDRAGRNWELSSYVEMASRTTIGQAHVQGGLDRYTQQGRYLVIVSDSPEECPLCRPFERRVLSLSGREPTPQELGQHPYGGSLAHARDEGFMHPNCTHSVSAFVPGLTQVKPPDENPQGYEDRQEQRALERAVRESKRRLAVSKAMGFEPHIRQDGARLAADQAALRTFIEEHDRKEYVSRQRVNLSYR